MIALDDMRRQLQLKTDNAAAELRKMADSIGKAMKEGRKDDAQKAKDEVAVLKEEQKALAEELARTEEAIRNELLNIPNIPYSGVFLKERPLPTTWRKHTAALCLVQPSAIAYWKPACKVSTFALKIYLWEKLNFTGRFSVIQATVCRRKTAVFVPGLLHSQRCRSESDAASAQERVSGYKDLAGILLRKKSPLQGNL